MFENFCKNIAQAHKTSTSYPLSSFQLKKWDHTNDILDVRDMYYVVCTQMLEDLKITKVTILYFILLWVNRTANTRSPNLIKRSTQSVISFCQSIISRSEINLLILLKRTYSSSMVSLQFKYLCAPVIWRLSQVIGISSASGWNNSPITAFCNNLSMDLYQLLISQYWSMTFSQIVLKRITWI